MRFSLEPRVSAPMWLNLALPVEAVAASMILCGGLIALAGANPVSAYAIMLKSALGGRNQIAETLVKAAPMILTGLAAVVAFRAKFWNIGAEGQLLAGAMAAVFIGTQPGLPTWSLVPLMLLASIAAGALCAAVPALLKQELKVDETICTLLLNFIILYAMMALLSGPWKDPVSGWADSPNIRMDAEFPILLHRTRLHLGILLAAVAAAAVWILFKKTTLGFGIDAVGENPRAAMHAGLNVKRLILVAAMTSGALAGLAGAGEVGGVQYQVLASISQGYGYSGLVVATLARLHPAGVSPAAVCLAAITGGAAEMSRQTGVPVYLADVIQGIALLCMLIALIFIRYRVRIRVRAAA